MYAMIVEVKLLRGDVIMKKFLSLLFILTTIFTSGSLITSSKVYAAETTAPFETVNAKLVSVTRTPNNSSEVTTTAYQKPSAVWDLSKQGSYTWSVTSHGTNIYSDYLFTGFDGIRIGGTEDSGVSGSFDLYLCISDAFFDTTYKYTITKNTIWSISTPLKTSNKIYFYVTSNDGNLTHIPYGAYISTIN